MGRSGDGSADSPVTGPPASKPRLRQRIVHDRELTVTDERRAARAASEARARTAALLAYAPMRGAKTVAAYVTRMGEPDSEGIRAGCAALGIRVLLPRLLAGDDLEFVVDAGRLRPGRRGTYEPLGAAVDLALADVIVVPALAVDRLGHRLGQGGGSYDRALHRARPGVPLIALLHPGELLARVPAEAHDIDVTEVALPGGVVRLSG